MSNLIGSLSALGVPDISEPSELELFGDNLLALVDPLDLEDSDLVAEAAAKNAPEFIALAEAAARIDATQALPLLAAAASALPKLTNMVFLDASDIALNSPHLLQNKGRDLAIALYDRVGEVRYANGLQAYSYLETLTRLGLAEKTARFRALEHLTSVSLKDSEDFLERLPKLIGLAHDHWNDDELITTLYLLLQHDISHADASYEIAQSTLRTALEASTVDAVLTGLTSARDQFISVENEEEARDDATLYRSALDLTLTFIAGTVANELVAESAKSLVNSINRRVAWNTRSGLGGWATPRRQAEAEWFALARTLCATISPLSEPSWNTPAETLVQVLAAYRASRSLTVMTGEGLRMVLEPTVETAFLRSEGLLHHLRFLVESERLNENERDAASELLDAISRPASSGSGEAVGKVWGAAPELAAELGTALSPEIATRLASMSETYPDLVKLLNDGSRTRAFAKSRDSDPLIDSLLGRVMECLVSCPGLDGRARDEFSELMTYLLKFAADRANIGRMNGGPEVKYLFKPATGKPYTEDFLQRDIATWLKASPLRRFVEMEQHDVAAGRADITVDQTYKFTIEVKRELKDASPATLLKSYGGQAAAYSVTGPSVSLEIVLDLTDQSKGTPTLDESVWVQKVPINGGEPRDVVTIVIHGNRLTPRDMKSA